MAGNIIIGGQPISDMQSEIQRNTQKSEELSRTTSAQQEANDAAFAGNTGVVNNRVSPYANFNSPYKLEQMMG